ncbi:hypothetical protein DL764_007071 [Monosporascus ibericus]|uniref:BHLH domain-containing protein n=1 Tax=Monosporascus ibericus TaxID=155417 RepID=A0A4Q4T3F7_9PEZI|nr:hypothetical protein DL764_007071 [Monosporascus ibericus]
MPRPAMPPTPASSTELRVQDSTKQLSSLQMAFELPPSALEAGGRVGAGARTSPAASPLKAQFPMQPSETVKSRRRSSAAAQKETFALPPPPTRSRKIIQMKPRGQDEPAESSSAPAKGGTQVASKNNTTGTGSKRKQPSATSAAGRKIARKTAHSLIERRRRSKMNEEFALLKSMIPACTGEMHKLAILQASIDYVRYLEDCISKLKSQRDAETPAAAPAEFRPSVPDTEELPEPEGSGGDGDGEEPEDVEMTGSEAPSPTFTATTHPHSKQPSMSPALSPQDATRERQRSYSSASTTDQRYYGYSSSTPSATSPLCGPRGYGGYAGDMASASHSTLASPALAPQLEDQEATAALLMLNADRRGVIGGGSGSGPARGMSVRDLLSS